jgi:hypothetical protein
MWGRTASQRLHPKNHAFDGGCTLLHASCWNKNDLKTESAIGLFVDSFEAQSFFEADAARLGGSDEAEILDKEDAVLKDPLAFYSFEFLRKHAAAGMSEIAGECDRADDRTVVKLYFAGKVRSAQLAAALQLGHGVDERWTRPGFAYALRLFERDDVGGGFFDDREAIKFELAENCGFSGAWGSGKDEAFHSVLTIRGMWLRSREARAKPRRLNPQSSARLDGTTGSHTRPDLAWDGIGGRY